MTAAGPMFSVVTPVYDPPLAALDQAIRSVINQSAPDWELILVDDLSPNPRVHAMLQAAAAADSRVKVFCRSVNGGIGASSQEALERANGQFVALLDHDDTLDPRALEYVAAAIRSRPDVDYVYTDEDKLDADGRTYDEFAKPDWSPERLRSHMYVGHLSVIRTELALAVGGFRPGFDGSQDHDLMLRVTERARSIVHVPRVLYHWRVVPGSTAADVNAKPYAGESGRRAVDDHLRRVGINAVATRGVLGGTYRVNRTLATERTVSLVVITSQAAGPVWGEQRQFAVEAVRSALAKTQHQNLEVVVVADERIDADARRELREIAGERLIFVDVDTTATWSQRRNLGFIHAGGEFVVFCDDDIDIATVGWLEALTGPLEESDVGLVGVKLLYPDSTVEHGGHVCQDRRFGYAFQGQRPDSGADFGALQVDREVSGVAGTCVAVRRAVFEEVGGFSVELPDGAIDIDLSSKTRAAGYRIVYLAQVTVFHLVPRASRPPRLDGPAETAAARRWRPPEVDRYLPPRSGWSDDLLDRHRR